MTTKTTTILACCVSMGLIATLAPAAHADDAPPAAPAPSLHPGVGGHFGIAVPLVFIRSENPPGNQSVGDQFTLAFPIGIGFSLTDKLALDLETIVGNPISPRGTTGLTVDPGIVYNAGPVVLGGRLGWDIGAATNFKLIPLVHKAVANIGAGANWFIEGAFPITFGFPSGKTTTELDIVFHTGIGF